MAWYFVNIPPWSTPHASGTGTRMGPLWSDFQTVLNLTKNSRLLTQANVQLFQYIDGAWKEVPVYI